MNLAGLVFALIAYSVLKFMIIGDVGGQPQPEVPEFGQFDANVDFRTIPSSCDGFTDCIEYVGDIIVNIVIGFVKLIEFIMNIIAYVVQLFIFLAQINIATIPDAPWYINILLLTPLTFLLTLLIFKLIRRGDDD